MVCFYVVLQRQDKSPMSSSSTKVKNKSWGTVVFVANWKPRTRHHHQRILVQIPNFSCWNLLRNMPRHHHHLLAHMLTCNHQGMLRNMLNHSCQCLWEKVQGVIVNTYQQSCHGIVFDLFRDEYISNKICKIFIVLILTKFVLSL